MDKEWRQLLMTAANQPGSFTDYIGGRITRVEDGVAESEVEATEHHINPIGSVHGGVLVTVMDHTAGTASATVSPPGATVNCDVHFLAPAKAGKLTCRAEVLRAGKRLNVIRAWIKDAQGTVVAEGTYTFSHPVSM